MLSARDEIVLFTINKFSIMHIWKKPPAGDARHSDRMATRRQFFRYSGIAVATGALILTGCNDDNEDCDLPICDPSKPVNLGSGDVGILNYAYALEQLESAFYALVLQGGYYASANADEKQVLADLEKHERAHTEFFKAAISSVATPIPELTFDFSAVNFNDRASVLGTAKTFEDLGVAAYNGAGKYLTNKDFVLVAGKIVSVEARHAAAIRDIFDSNPRSFAGDDVVDANGLDRAFEPSQVLSAASAFIVNEIDASNLPS